MYKNFYNRPCSNLPRAIFDKLCHMSIEELNTFINSKLAKNIIPHVDKNSESEAFVRIPDDLMENKTKPYIKSEEDRLGFLFHIYVFTYSRRHKKNVFRDFDKFKQQFDLGKKTLITDVQNDLENKVLWEIKIIYHFTKGFILFPNKQETIEVKPKEKLRIEENTEIKQIQKQLKELEKRLGKDKAEKTAEHFELSKKLYNLQNKFIDKDEELPF